MDCWQLSKLTGRLAIENELQRPFRTVRAHFDLRGTTCPVGRLGRYWMGSPSWQQMGRRQSIDEVENFSEQFPRHRYLRQLVHDVPWQYQRG